MRPFFLGILFPVDISCSLAVTLEGTVIHKSGLITGGRSTHGNNKKWDEKDVQGMLINSFLHQYIMTDSSLDRFDSGARYVAG